MDEDDVLMNFEEVSYDEALKQTDYTMVTNQPEFNWIT